MEMNDDLISRKALAETAKNMSSSLLNEWDTLGVLELIYRQPSVDPHKHGRWIIGEMGVFGCPIHCSECGWGSDCADRDKWMHYPGHKFCGACGAKMDGGEEASTNGD